MAPAGTDGCTLPTPFCSLGPSVPEDAAVSAPTIAKDVIVETAPLGSRVVWRTRLETVPPGGVYVVTKTSPPESVAVTTLPGVTLDSTTLCPREFVVVTSLGRVASTSTDGVN